MIIWNGFGFIAFVIPFFTLIATEIFVEGMFQDSEYYQMNNWPAFLGLLVSAAIIYFINKMYLSKNLEKTVIDKETGKEIVLKDKHAMFWIDLKYWPAIIAGIAVLSLLR